MTYKEKRKITLLERTKKKMKTTPFLKEKCFIWHSNSSGSSSSNSEDDHYFVNKTRHPRDKE